MCCKYSIPCIEHIPALVLVRAASGIRCSLISFCNGANSFFTKFLIIIKYFQVHFLLLNMVTWNYGELFLSSQKYHVKFFHNLLENRILLENNYHRFFFCTIPCFSNSFRTDERVVGVILWKIFLS